MDSPVSFQNFTLLAHWDDPTIQQLKSFCFGKSLSRRSVKLKHCRLSSPYSIPVGKDGKAPGDSSSIGCEISLAEEAGVCMPPILP